MDIQSYLKRINQKEVKKLDLETLAELQMNHLLHVPFENLDVIRKVKVPLDIQASYQKVVENRRGGFCYELNSLFHWLLTSLGYKAHLISSTVRKPDGSWTIEGSHATIIVELDQPYLVDVGFGDCARKPIPLTEEIHRDVSGAYRITPIEKDMYDLQRMDADNKWLTKFRLNITPRKLADFKEQCHFNQTSPESHFTQREIVTIATKEGRVTFSDNSLTITHEGVRNKEPVQTDERAAILKEYFGIEL